MSIIRRYWRIIFPIFFVLVIWSFSDHNGTVSDAESAGVAALFGLSNEVARKLAHLFLFGALGYSCTSFIKGLHPISFPKYTQIFYPIIFVTIYGALDEVHQLTVVGRNASAGDVLVDAIAGFGGVLVYIIIFCLYRLWRIRRIQNSFEQ
ncbi:VanZ family protein [Candidatus Saccharibacteria bacterium]|nr:VanZ family protein [Candidatus Saccharibacteria bacterium]